MVKDKITKLFGSVDSVEESPNEEIVEVVPEPVAPPAPDDMWARWDNFSKEEFMCKCGCGRADMNVEFMDRLQSLRTNLGQPLKITSGYRCPEHNEKVSSTGRKGPHTTGRAADVQILGYTAYRFLPMAMAAGITGIGLSQKGDHASRFIHVDDLPNKTERPRPWIWTY